ncbi:alanine racemase [Shewanella surugensis]|uniref:Alanine racemase n=1 Tax=Shewanella surugensis TaxID=212020 RepID=A0ABT0LHN3_9GAMM|nr:alanine racemase [Shewanella surugensis]MCL1127213.1 alanine racemase [Shewanella surugensis]
MAILTKNAKTVFLMGEGQASENSAALGSQLMQYRQALKAQDLPLAYVDLDKLDANITALTLRGGGKPLRVASKSIRSVSMLKYLLAKSPALKGIMCFHPQEAVYLAEQGLDDLLVAYPSMQSSAISSIAQWLKKGQRIVLMVDAPEQLALLDLTGQRLGVCFPICMDIDMSLSLPGLHFGVRRSPINSVEKALSLYDEIKATLGVKLVGVMGYEAQIAGLGDRMPGQYFKSLAIRLLKRLSIPHVAKRRQNVVYALTQAGARLDFVNGGGTGSLGSTSQDPSVTEMTVGSGFYCPHLFDYYDDVRLAPAAGFALEVVRKPDCNHFTCAGGGYLASGSADRFRLPQPYLPQGLSLDVNEGAGEVQTPLRCSDSRVIHENQYSPTGIDTHPNPNSHPLPSAQLVPTLAIGDSVFFRHGKAGEICERFSTLYGVRGVSVEQHFQTYRGEGKGFM